MTHRCIKPDISEQLLRMTVQGASLESSQVILWRGPAEEIWEEGMYIHVCQGFPGILF